MYFLIFVDMNISFLDGFLGVLAPGTCKIRFSSKSCCNYVDSGPDWVPGAFREYVSDELEMSRIRNEPN